MFTNLREIDENNLHTLPLNSRIFLEHKTQKNYMGSVDGKKNFFCCWFMGYHDKIVYIDDFKNAQFCAGDKNIKGVVGKIKEISINDINLPFYTNNVKRTIELPPLSSTTIHPTSQPLQPLRPLPRGGKSRKSKKSKKSRKSRKSRKK